MMNGVQVRWLLALSLVLTCAAQNNHNNNPNGNTDTALEPPADYVDDVYHCDDPLLVYPFIENPTDTVSCSKDTWKWNVEELTDVPPVICAGIQDFQPIDWEDLQIEDWFEPCLLWAMTYGGLKSTNFTEAPAIADDLYHCRDPSNVREGSISCNETTLLWQVDELKEDSPPDMCGSDFEIPPEEVPNIQDWFEPCVLWAITYGNLMPTPSPTTITPSPTAAVVGESSGESSNVVVLDPLVLTLIWPDNVLVADGTLASVDQLELRTLTERHVLEGLQAELGLALVTAVNLIFNAGIPTSNSMTYSLSGTVSMRDDSGIPSTTVQRVVKQAFKGNALELFEFRLQISEDATLKKVDSVVVGTEIDFDTITGGSSNTETGDESDGNMDTVMIAVIASVSSAFVAVCCIGCCFLYHSHQKAKMEAARSVRSRGKSKGSVASSSIMSRSRKSEKSRRSGRSSHKDEIGPVPTKSLSAEEVFPPLYEEDDDYDDEENQRSLVTMSELDDQSQGGVGFTGPVASDDHSVGTSVYSYFNDDTSLLGGGASMANNSFLYSINGKDNLKEAAADDDTFAELYGDSNKASKERKGEKKGLMWSVLDTLATHFGGESDREVDAEPPKRKTHSTMLGPAPDNDSDNESNHSATLLFDDDKSNKSAEKPVLVLDLSKTTDDEVEDYDAEDTSPQATTPVKERLERMWQQAEEEDKELEESMTSSKASKDASPKPDNLQKTLKQSNLGKNPNVKVFHDDGSANASGNSVNSSVETDCSPSASALLDSASVKSGSALLDAAPAHAVPQFVNRISKKSKKTHDNQGDDDDDDDDNKMALFLPTQLQAVDPNNDNMSQSSSISSRSGHSSRSARSGLSAGSHGIAFGENKPGQSARKKDKKWSSNTSPSSASVVSSSSTDSAKYRSLLNQGDTNDAALFGLKDGDDEASVDSGLEATQLKYEAAESSKKKKDEPKAQSPAAQLSKLIKSFDEVWSKGEEKPKATGSERVSAPASSPSSSKKSALQDAADSDDEDVYVEGNDDDDDDDDDESDHSDSSSAIRRAAASRIVQAQELGSLLTNSNKKDAAGAPQTKSVDGEIQRRLSFEIVDSSDDETYEEKKDEKETLEAKQRAEEINMERLRRLSIAGYADSMASF